MEQVSLDSYPSHILQDLDILLDLEVSRNSVVLLNLLLGIHLRDNFYSPLLGNVLQKANLSQRLDLEDYLHSQVLLNLFFGLLNMQQVFIESVVILLIYVQEHLKDLVHSRNLVVLLNLQHGIHLKDNFYSPLLVMQKRRIQNLMLVLEESEILLHLKQRNNHLIMLVLVQLICYQENQNVMSWKNLPTLHLISMFLEVTISTSVILTSTMDQRILVMLNSDG